MSSGAGMAQRSMQRQICVQLWGRRKVAGRAQAGIRHCPHAQPGRQQAPGSRQYASAADAPLPAAPRAESRQ